MDELAPGLFVPDWPAPPGVRVVTTGRTGGQSRAPFDTFNLATHVGDDPAAVAANRARLRQVAALPSEPRWLEQVHGVAVVDAGAKVMHVPQADGAWSDRAGVVCAVMTADCLPVLLCDRAGHQVAAVHAGWRGLLAGVIEAAVARFDGGGEAVLAWLGPAIGPTAFEVGDEVRAAFVARDGAAAAAFAPSSGGRWYADLFLLARQRLHGCGVAAIHGGGDCTFSQPDRYYSYRRDGTTGRMASLIWREAV